MSERSHDPASPESPDTTALGNAAQERSQTGVRIIVTVADRYLFETGVVSGRQIKERAGVPERFALHRRVRGGNEPVADDDQVALRPGDHFFARPSANAR